MWRALFVQMEHLSVQMEAHAVSFRQENGVVVHFQMLSAAAMEFTAVLMDTLVVVECVVEEANSYLCPRSCQPQKDTWM